MGSQITRERHHRIFGSTVSSLDRADQWESPHSGLTKEEIRIRQQEFLDRVAVSKHAPSEDKRQKHILKNKNLADRAEMDNLFGPLLWLYASITIAKEEVDLTENSAEAIKADTNSEKVSRKVSEEDTTFTPLFKRAIRVIDRVLKQNGIEATDHLNRHEQLRVSSTAEHAFLFDMITTRRVILTGVPHRVGRDLYRYITKKYHAVKFAFIGITDNGSKRVARDVFCKDKVHNSSDEAYEKYITKSNFEVVDNNHMYVVFPENDEFIKNIIEEGIEKNIYEAESRRMRYLTPKYTPPPLPDHIRKLEEKRRRKEEAQMRQRRSKFRCEPCRLPVLPARSPNITQRGKEERLPRKQPQTNVPQPSSPSLLSSASPSLSASPSSTPAVTVSCPLSFKLNIEHSTPTGTSKEAPDFAAAVSRRATLDVRQSPIALPAGDGRTPRGSISRRDIILSSRKPSLAPTMTTSRGGKKARRDTLMSGALLKNAENRLQEINLHFRRRMKMFRFDEKKQTSLEQRNSENRREQQLLKALSKQVEVLGRVTGTVTSSSQPSESWGKYT